MTVDIHNPERMEALARPPKHLDDLAVDRFAAAMKTKLAKKRDDGYGGWDDPDECSIEYLSYLLVQHIHKGDPVDIANFAMMLHQRGSKLIVDADTAAISKLLPTTNSAAAHPSSAQDSPPIVWWFRDHTGCDYIGMDGELHRKLAEGMGEVAQRVRVAPLDYGQRQVDAIMTLIEERLAIIWARPGSREFFEAELRDALNGSEVAE